LRYLLRPENVASIPALRPLVHNKIVQALLPKWQPEPFGVPCQGGWLSSFYGWKGEFSFTNFEVWIHLGYASKCRGRYNELSNTNKKVANYFLESYESMLSYFCFFPCPFSFFLPEPGSCLFVADI
jgi:hypothetical protein